MDSPKYVPAMIQKNLLNDETAYLQWGQQSQLNFTVMNFETPLTSSIKNWPTKDEPDNNY